MPCPCGQCEERRHGVWCSWALYHFIIYASDVKIGYEESRLASKRQGYFEARAELSELLDSIASGEWKLVAIHMRGSLRRFVHCECERRGWAHGTVMINDSKAVKVFCPDFGDADPWKMKPVDTKVPRTLFCPNAESVPWPTRIWKPWTVTNVKGRPYGSFTSTCDTVPTLLEREEDEEKVAQIIALGDPNFDPAMENISDDSDVDGRTRRRTKTKRTMKAEFAVGRKGVPRRTLRVDGAVGQSTCRLSACTFGAGAMDSTELPVRRWNRRSPVQDVCKRRWKTRARVCRWKKAVVKRVIIPYGHLTAETWEKLKKSPLCAAKMSTSQQGKRRRRTRLGRLRRVLERVQPGCTTRPRKKCTNDPWEILPCGGQFPDYARTRSCRGRSEQRLQRC